MWDPGFFDVWGCSGTAPGLFLFRGMVFLVSDQKFLGGDLWVCGGFGLDLDHVDSGWEMVGGERFGILTFVVKLPELVVYF